jgi:Rap1a immunity proteins
MNTQHFPLMATALATALYMSAPACAAVAISGDDLQALCADYDRPTDAATCLGYVKGVANVLAGGAAVQGSKACLNDAASDERLVAIVRDYLENAGDTGRQPADVLVANALAKSYPCAK